MVAIVRFYLGICLTSLAEADPCTSGRTVTTEAEFDVIKDCSSLAGFFWFSMEKDISLEMENLKEAENIYIMGSGVKDISFPALKTANILRVRSTPNLEKFQLPSLSKSLAIFLVDTGKLQSVSFDAGLSLEILKVANTAIEQVAGITAKEMMHIQLNSNPKLKLDLPSLETVLSLNLTGNYSRSFDIPSLSRINFDMNLSQTHNVSIPSLEKVNGAVIIDKYTEKEFTLPIQSITHSLVVTNSPSLTTFSLPNLHTVRSLEVKGNPELATLNLNSLSEVVTGINIEADKLIEININHIPKQLYRAHAQLPFFCKLTVQGINGPYTKRCSRAIQKLQIYS
ncbi:cell wall protein Ecm33 [Entomophthora muscae]|uniref:Cell wall protein Ecm33 n=1 Tax=Entomophthora muscae TaxID=34485 RepID=A0ACC2UR74_9FUNG|nr:cell wall protein Ecm33 [Entomophthora muscae]